MLICVVLFIIYYLFTKLTNTINNTNSVVNKIEALEEKILTTPINSDNISSDKILNIKDSRPGYIDINIPTRQMDEIKQLGALYKVDATDKNIPPGNNTNTSVLPLFGRRKYKGSTKWIYYTYSDNYHNVRIPLYHKNKKCDTELGCDELYNNDNINIPALNGNYKIELYENEKHFYIPKI
tara:strand:- start:706 stop:1248 length:543 start_codon:yes stop_codon:yes gene_type:complete